MLNKTLLKRMTQKDVRMLYLNRVHCTSYGIADTVRRTVRNIREDCRATGTDRLADKLANYGNNGLWGAEQIRLLSRALFQPKRPPQDGRHWRTIEFECIFRTPSDLDQFTSKVRAYPGLKDVTTIKTDGSVHDRDRRDATPREIVFSYVKGEENKVRTMCAMLAAHAYVNKTCGTHVHFDMRGKSEKEVELLGGRIAKYVPILRKMLPNERRNNTYCYEPINTFVRGDRYSFVNLQSYNKHKTLEIRGHSGTINATKILNWIAICETIMTMRVRATFDVHTCTDLATLYRLDRTLAHYMATREGKFADQHATEGEGYEMAHAA